MKEKDLVQYFEEEFLDIIKPLLIGRDKGYPSHNWLEPDGIGTSRKETHASMFRHLAESSTGQRKVHDADIHPLLCVAARAMMEYTRQQRGIKHSEDK